MYITYNIVKIIRSNIKEKCILDSKRSELFEVKNLFFVSVILFYFGVV